MKCKKCGATLLMEQIPEVHISEAEVDCNQPDCDGRATYINPKGITNDQATASTSTILMEDKNA